MTRPSAVSARFPLLPFTQRDDISKLSDVDAASRYYRYLRWKEKLMTQSYRHDDLLRDRLVYAFSRVNEKLKERWPDKSVEDIGTF